ncbi:MAG: hypothetical protein AAGC68_16935, partial [Verrucomicrobiota bacterium]
MASVFLGALAPSTEPLLSPLEDRLEEEGHEVMRSTSFPTTKEEMEGIEHFVLLSPGERPDRWEEWLTHLSDPASEVVRATTIFVDGATGEEWLEKHLTAKLFDDDADLLKQLSGLPWFSLQQDDPFLKVEPEPASEEKAKPKGLRCPYPGLRPFGEEDVGDLFGGDDIVPHLVKRASEVPLLVLMRNVESG